MLNLWLLRQTVEELAPDRLAGGRGEGLEKQVEGDAAAEGGVDGMVDVRGEEDDTAEVLKFAEEDADELVPVDLLVRSLT